MKTKEKLAHALIQANAPGTMVDAAMNGDYDDFESKSATPINDLVRDCRERGLDAIAKQAMDGDFDATREESEAWFEREGKTLFGEKL